MNHPDAGEWMEFLYGESTVKRKLELEAHLAGCAACEAQVKAWQGSTRALDAWTLPAAPAPRAIGHGWKWAAAAAIVLLFGFWAGRLTAGSRAELAELKNSVAELTKQVEQGNTATFSNSVVVATSAANEQTLQLLADYGRLQNARQRADLEALGLALQDFKTRLASLRAELETVAVNTETGFEATHESLDRVVAISTRQSDDTDKSNLP